jgi:universal stress protein A
MNQYHRILVATDSVEQCCPILDRARAFLEDDDSASLSLLQVLEHVPATIPTEVIPPEGMDVIAGMELNARNRLSQLAEQNQLGDAEVLVVSGSPKEEIVRIAKDKKADLIVIGTCERHGLDRLRPSTTNSVVHHASCDVLTVHTACDVDKVGDYSSLG